MIFEAFLVSATLLCSLVAGFLFAFAIVVMPGIGRLDDRSFIRTFQVMDGIIQDNHPVFIFVCLGSTITLIVSAVIGFTHLEGLNRAILVAAAFVHLLCVQLPTVGINIPLNNRLQTHDVDQMTEQEIAVARREFEVRWNRWNINRTVAATAVTVALILLVLKA